MTAPTLPTRAERDRLVEWIEGKRHPFDRRPVATVKRLLDWADAQGQVERDEGPARRALRRLVTECDSPRCFGGLMSFCEAVRNGAAVLTGGQAPERGPWALRRGRVTKKPKRGRPRGYE